VPRPSSRPIRKSAYGSARSMGDSCVIV
jgi:hypothetical protein